MFKRKIIYMLSFLILIAGTVSAHTDSIDVGHHEMMGSYSLGMGFFGWFLMTLLIVAVTLIILLLVKEIQKK